MRDEKERRQEARQAVAAAAQAVSAPERTPMRVDSRNLGWLVAAFLAGILIGAVVLFAYAWMQV